MTQQWLGSFFFGRSVLIYRGQAADNSQHAHASVQLSVAQTGSLRILDADDQLHTAPGLITRRVLATYCNPPKQ